jgi:hypothetical protein
MASLTLKQKEVKDDSYNTPHECFEDIKKYIPNREKLIVYEPFILNNKYSTSKSSLLSLEFKKVIGETDWDFFEMYNKLDYDIIISNPPFSIKNKIFKLLKQIDKPFILIVPVSIITKKYFMEDYKDQYQIIIPKKRIQFIKDDKQLNRCWFDCCFIAYKMNLEKDITYIE